MKTFRFKNIKYLFSENTYLFSFPDENVFKENLQRIFKIEGTLPFSNTSINYHALNLQLKAW